MTKLNITRSDIIALLALTVSLASLFITYRVYREETDTDFVIRVEPLYYSEVKFRYQAEEQLSGAEGKVDERGRTIVPDHPAAHIVKFPPKGVITFPVAIIVTNNSRRNVPIRNAYYFVVNQLENTSSTMNTLHLAETEPNSNKEHPRLPINIPPGESRAFKSSVAIYYEEPIAEQLRSIFEHASEFAESKLHHPSLARLNFFAVASGDLKAQGGSSYPYLSPDFIKNYTLLVGMEDFTNNHRSETVKFLFPSDEFTSFVIAPPGETRAFKLSSDQRKLLKLPPESPESNKQIVTRKEELLNQLAEIIALTETKGECCRH